MMLKFAILCSVTAITILPICEVESNSQSKLDIDDIVNLLRHKPGDVTSDESTMAKSRVTDDEDNSHYGSLTSREIIELIQQANRDTNKYEKLNKNSKLYGKSFRPIHHNHLGVSSHQHKKKSQPSDYANEANLDKLFSYYGIQKPSLHGDRYRERWYPNKINKGLNTNKMRNEAVDNLDDYSKVYIILNPSAIQKSKSKDSLSNLITKVLSLSDRNVRGDGQKKEYYKGFPVLSDLISRRSRKDSRESFGPKDSMEDYKQKRSRNDHGGGGGSGGGRTAIPYIRQRGDIYERDN